LFHEPLWARIVGAGLGGKALCLLLEHDGQVIGGASGFFLRVLWARFLYLGFPYGGFLGSTPPGGLLAKLLVDFARKENVTRVRITDGPGMPSTPPDGFCVQPGQTQLLDLARRSATDLLQTFPKNIRRDVRRAERSGVRLSPVRDRRDLDEFYSLYLASMRRNQAVPKYGKLLVATLYDHVIRCGKGELWLARRSGLAISGVLVVDSAHASHYLLGGSRADTLKYCPNELLLLQAIRRAVQLGKECFDFLPSGPQNPGLARFKSKWGGQDTRADTLDLVTKPWSQKLYDTAYRIAGSSLLSSVSCHLRNLRHIR